MRDAGRPRPEGSRLATRSPGAKNGAVETADRDGRICWVCSGPVRSTRTRPTTTGGTFIWARDNRAVWRFSGTDISNSYILYNTYVRVLEAHGRFVSERIGLRCVNVFQIYPPHHHLPGGKFTRVRQRRVYLSYNSRRVFDSLQSLRIRRAFCSHA